MRIIEPMAHRDDRPSSARQPGEAADPSGACPAGEPGRGHRRTGLSGLRTWLGWVGFFFAWAFVIHGATCLLHEVGGHALAAKILGCGIDGIDLTYFGPAQTAPTLCVKVWRWTWTKRMIFDLAGLVVTISAGAVMMAFQRRAGLAPLTRMLLALLAMWLLLGGLAYATWGGFHDVADPAYAARRLATHGLHVLAWLPPLVLYAASAAFGGCAFVDAFRAHFGSRSRIHTLKQVTATLGAAGVLYLVAWYVESRIGIAAAIGQGLSDEFAQSAAAQGAAAHSAAAQSAAAQSAAAQSAAAQSAAAQSAAAQSATPQFSMDYVIFVVAIAAFIFALARPVIRGDGMQDSARSIPRRHAIGVAVATLVCFVVITLVTYMRAAPVAN
jgi:hypothetical protein